MCVSSVCQRRATAAHTICMNTLDSRLWLHGEVRTTTYAYRVRRVHLTWHGKGGGGRRGRRRA